MRLNVKCCVTRVEKTVIAVFLADFILRRQDFVTWAESGSRRTVCCLYSNSFSYHSELESR